MHERGVAQYYRTWQLTTQPPRTITRRHQHKQRCNDKLTTIHTHCKGRFTTIYIIHKNPPKPAPTAPTPQIIEAQTWVKGASGTERALHPKLTLQSIHARIAKHFKNDLGLL